jgi:hypothetical protein
MERRTVLKSLSLAPLALVRAGHLFAAPTDDAKLLIVFLRGGYDAANLLIPVSSPFYYESRPNIAIARPGPDANAALALDADWGLHPALRSSIHPLFLKKQAAFIPFAGTDDLSRSHFETQDSIELGQPLGSGRDFQSGFLNRLVAEMSGRKGMSFTDQLPLIFRGAVQVPNMALRNLAKPGFDPRQAAIIRDMYRGTWLEAPVTEGFSVRDEVARDMASEMELASRNALTTKGFELEARRIAKLMAERYSIGFVDVGGWDTHVGEGAAWATSQRAWRNSGAGSPRLRMRWDRRGIPLWWSSSVSSDARSARMAIAEPTMDMAASTGYSAVASVAGAWQGSRCESSTRRCSRTATIPCSTNIVLSLAGWPRESSTSISHGYKRFSRELGLATSSSSSCEAAMYVDRPLLAGSGLPLSTPIADVRISTEPGGNIDVAYRRGFERVISAVSIPAEAWLRAA